MKLAEDKGVDFAGLGLDEMRDIEPKIDQRALEVLTVERAVESRTSFGGTAPDNVRRAAKEARGRFL